MARNGERTRSSFAGIPNIPMSNLASGSGDIRKCYFRKMRSVGRWQRVQMMGRPARMRTESSTASPPFHTVFPGLVSIIIDFTDQYQLYINVITITQCCMQTRHLVPGWTSLSMLVSSSQLHRYYLLSSKHDSLLQAGVYPIPKGRQAIQLWWGCCL